MSDTLLIELGTEELPPKTLKKLSTAFTKECLNGLAEQGLINSESVSKSYASPRRLAMTVSNTLDTQTDQNSERRGPAVKAAFDENGEATPAALGFAKSCGVDVSELERISTDKGEWLSFSMTEKGKSITELLPNILEQALKRLPIAKRMRWGDGDAEFVRPVKWLLCMHGSSVIPATVLERAASNISHGHRFHGTDTIKLQHAEEYESTLLNKGHVLANFSDRQALILEQIQALAKSVNGHLEENSSLLDEVTGLVEYPYSLLGKFDQAFLAVPQECLISSMRDHQKYFHLLDDQQRLLPYFITVNNINSSDTQRVVQGNERVLRARLSDAEFFWQTDQKTTLAERVDNLSGVLFHQKLGTVLDKTNRLEKLSMQIAKALSADHNIDTILVGRGAHLAKADLVSDMVGEFDELQGVMGHYYADRDGEHSIVGECIEQHYWPKFAGDQLPVSFEAQAVALADKLDSLVGIFGTGEIPTGDKDPYGLRRAALSILRILIEKEHHLGLSTLVTMASDVYKGVSQIVIEKESQHNIIDFIRSRLTAFYQNQDIATTTINAVMVCKPDSPLDFDRRVKAVHLFTSLAEASDLAAANKRIANILKKQTLDQGISIDPSLFTEEDEIALYDAIESVQSNCISLFDTGDYQAGLKPLASLRNPVDQFFENVMVMSDDPKLQTNRLALLNVIQQLFLRVADISLLDTQEK